MPSGSESAAAAARAAKKNKPTPPHAISKIGAAFEILSIIRALKKGTFSMGNYSKFIGAIIGSGVGWGASWVAVHAPGISSCGVDGCSVLGLSSAQITGALTGVLATVFVRQFPPNRK